MTAILHTHRLVDKALDGIVIGGINLVQVDGVIDVVPHVVVKLHMVLKALRDGERVQSLPSSDLSDCQGYLSPLIKLMAGDTADEADSLFSAIL